MTAEHPPDIRPPVRIDSSLRARLCGICLAPLHRRRAVGHRRGADRGVLSGSGPGPLQVAEPPERRDHRRADGRAGRSPGEAWPSSSVGRRRIRPDSQPPHQSVPSCPWPGRARSGGHHRPGGGRPRTLERRVRRGRCRLVRLSEPGATLGARNAANRTADHDRRLVAVLGPVADTSGLSSRATWTVHRTGVRTGLADGDGGVRAGRRIRRRFLRGAPAWRGCCVGDLFDGRGDRRPGGRSYRRRAAGDESGLSLSAHVPDERRPGHGVVDVVSRAAALQTTRCRARRRLRGGNRDPHAPEPCADPVRPRHVPAVGRRPRSNPPEARPFSVCCCFSAAPSPRAWWWPISMRGGTAGC